MKTSSHRLESLRSYIFEQMRQWKVDAEKRGLSIIDGGLGDPVESTSNIVIDALCEAVHDPSTHHYALGGGTPEFKETLCGYYNRRFGVSLDPKTECVALLGSKEGISHLMLALCDSGDCVLLPDPGYPAYRAGAIIAGCKWAPIPLLEKNDYLPDYESIDSAILDKATLLFLNYPNNPTGAEASLDFFERTVYYAKKHDFAVCHDGAYLDAGLDGRRPPSFLQIDGARDVGIETYSLSKPFNMTGWRVAAAVGCSKIIASLAKVKSYYDTGMFIAIQRAGIEALRNAESIIPPQMVFYQRRKDLIEKRLNKTRCSTGLKIYAPRGGFYYWFSLPKGMDAIDTARDLALTRGVFLTPGIAFGEQGKNHLRLSLTMPDADLEQAINHIKDYFSGLLTE